MAQKDTLFRILNRCTFYRNAFRVSGWLLFLSMIIATGLAGFILKLTTHQKPPQFIICTVDGRMIPITSLKKGSR